VFCPTRPWEPFSRDPNLAYSGLTFKSAEAFYKGASWKVPSERHSPGNLEILVYPWPSARALPHAPYWLFIRALPSSHSQLTSIRSKIDCVALVFLRKYHSQKTLARNPLGDRPNSQDSGKAAIPALQAGASSRKALPPLWSATFEGKFEVVHS